MITTHAGPPILSGLVALLQDGSTHTQVMIRIEHLPWRTEPFLVVAPINLHQADINRALALTEPARQCLLGR